MVIIWQLLHALILLALEFYPYPELVIYPYLRALGWLPYTQILDQHFPGLMFLPLNLNSLRFTDPASLHLLLILVVLVQSVLIYKISRQWVAVAFFSLWQPFFEGNQLWIDTLLPLFTLPAWLFFTKKKWFWAGLFLGLGIVFKQTLIPLVIFCGLYLIWQYRRKVMPILLPFTLGAVLPSLLMLIYFAKIGVLHDWWFWTVQFNLTAYAHGGKLAPTLGQWLKLSWPIAVLGLAAWRLPKYRLMLGWLGLSVVGGLARFGFVHLQPAIPYFCIIYSALILATWRQSKLLALGLLAPTALWVGWFFLHTSWGGVHFYSQADYQIAHAISSRVQAGDHIFLLGVNPHLYQLTNTLPTGGVFVFQFPWFLQVAGERVLTGLHADPPKLIVYDPASQIDGQYLKDYASYLVDYTQANYQAVATVGVSIIYEKRD